MRQAVRSARQPRTGGRGSVASSRRVVIQIPCTLRSPSRRHHAQQNVGHYLPVAACTKNQQTHIDLRARGEPLTSGIGAMEFFHRGLPRLGDTLSRKDLPERHRDNLQVEPKGQMIDIPNVQVKFLFPGERIAAVDLGQAGDAGRTSCRRACSGEYSPRYCIRSGRGPTRLMSPRRTFHSSGSSSRLVPRRKRPKEVRRRASGSGIPLASLASLIVRNFSSVNGLAAQAGPLLAEEDRSSEKHSHRTLPARDHGEETSSAAAATRHPSPLAPAAIPVSHTRDSRPPELPGGTAPRTYPRQQKGRGTSSSSARPRSPMAASSSGARLDSSQTAAASAPGSSGLTHTPAPAS